MKYRIRTTRDGARQVQVTGRIGHTIVSGSRAIFEAHASIEDIIEAVEFARKSFDREVAAAANLTDLLGGGE